MTLKREQFFKLIGLLLLGYLWLCYIFSSSWIMLYIYIHTHTFIRLWTDRTTKRNASAFTSFTM